VKVLKLSVVLGHEGGSGCHPANVGFQSTLFCRIIAWQPYYIAWYVSYSEETDTIA